jgi:hypothetical protein
VTTDPDARLEVALAVGDAATMFRTVKTGLERERAPPRAGPPLLRTFNNHLTFA